MAYHWWRLALNASLFVRRAASSFVIRFIGKVCLMVVSSQILFFILTLANILTDGSCFT